MHLVLQTFFQVARILIKKGGAQSDDGNVQKETRSERYNRKREREERLERLIICICGRVQ